MILGTCWYVMTYEMMCNDASTMCPGVVASWSGVQRIIPHDLPIQLTLVMNMRQLIGHTAFNNVTSITQHFDKLYSMLGGIADHDC